MVYANKENYNKMKLWKSRKYEGGRKEILIV